MNWLRMIWGGVKGALSRTNVGDIVGSLSDLYLKRAEAQSSEEIAKIDAEIEVLKMQAKQTANLQGYWITAWIRPAFAGLAFFYFGKVLVWDASLHLGTTDRVEGIVEWGLGAIISFYFIVRPFEKRA